VIDGTCHLDIPDSDKMPGFLVGKGSRPVQEQRSIKLDYVILLEARTPFNL
jgi:hypothetical protein